MTYREDPDWQDAQRRYIGDDNTGASPDEVLAEGIKAAFDMYRIETLAQPTAGGADRAP